MRNIFLLSLCVLLDMQCCSQYKKVEKNDPLFQESLSLAGLWMSDRYLNEIAKSKSVYSAKDREPMPLGFLLQKENLKSDSAMLLGFSSHEGGYDVPICFNKGRFEFDAKRMNLSAPILDPFELDIIDGDNLAMRSLVDEKMELYHRIVDVQNELRKILFEGEFISTTNNDKFFFDRTGKLVGFPRKTSFEVIYDFGLNIQFDAIVMYDGIKMGNWSDGDIYKFEIVSNTLKLYRVNTDWEGMQHTIGELTYDLKRK